MSSIHSLLVAGDETLAEIGDPQADRDDTTQQHQNPFPILTMPFTPSFVVAGEENPTNNAVHEIRLSPPPAALSEEAMPSIAELERDLLGPLAATLPDTCPAEDLVIPKSSQAEVESKDVDTRVANDSGDQPTTNPDLDNDQSLPPHYRNPNAFYQRRPHESPEDFKNRLLSETWEERRRLLGIGLAPQAQDDASPDKSSKPSLKEKCKSCTDFDIHAPHLNDLSECTCDGGGCNAGDPCSICEGLITGGIAVGNKCSEQRLDHEHASDCYNCARLVLLNTSCQPFHKATIGATRALVASDLFTPAREKYFSSTPCSDCAPKVSKGIADCKDCDEQTPDHEHFLYCFTCARYVLLSSQKSHEATRVVVVPDTLPPASEKCIGGAPCSICKQLMIIGKADCKRCRKRIYEHEHAKSCFNCLRCYFVVEKSLPFHNSIVTAARIVGLPETPSGLAHTLVCPQPKDTASDMSGENGKLMWDLIAAGEVILGCSSASTASTASDESEDRLAAPLPSLVPAGDVCLWTNPCSLCKPLITMGKAHCKDCLKCDLGPAHAVRCFNCLRNYLLIHHSQESHIATVVAARVLRLKRAPRALDVTSVDPMPEAFTSDKCPDNSDLARDRSSAPTPSDTSCDSETEDDEAGEASDDSSATSSRSVSLEPESMDIVVQQVEEDATPPSPRPTSPEPEPMEIVQQAEEVAETSSSSSVSPEPESMQIVEQQVEDVAEPTSPCPTSPEPEPSKVVAQSVQEVTQPPSPRPTSPAPEHMEIVPQQVEESTQPPSPRSVSPEAEHMDIVVHQDEEDAQAPSPPATRSHKRKRRLSQVLSPTPEPRSSASPDPIPRTVKRHTHLPAYTYQPPRSPSPIPPARPGALGLPLHSILTTTPINPLAAVPFPHLPAVDFAVSRRQRENRAFLEDYEKRAFNASRASLQFEREAAYARMRDLERQDEEMRKGEVARLRVVIERLERNDYY